MDQPTQEEIEFSLSVEDQTVRYLEQCRSRSQEPSSRGLALFMLEDTGEHVIVTAGGIDLRQTLADVLAGAIMGVGSGGSMYRVIVTRERKTDVPTVSRGYTTDKNSDEEVILP